MQIDPVGIPTAGAVVYVRVPDMAKDSDADRARIQWPSDEELTRIDELLTHLGGPNVSWGRQQVLDVWVMEQRLEADRLAARRVLFATWVLAVATVGLVLATIGLIVVTVGD